MLSGVLGFPLQPIDGHTLIASWPLSHVPIFFLPLDEMAGRHLLHNTPKICWMTKKQNGVNPVNGKSLDDLYQHTQDKIQYIKGQGYNVVEMWECQWLASIKRDLELSRFIEHR
jgi:hypothetical protein